MKAQSRSLYLIYCLGAFLVGAVISIMVVFNTNLGLATSNSVSIAVNQFTGIIAITLVMMIGRKNVTINPKREPAPLWQWFGGLFGLGVMTLNYFSVAKTGATIGLACTVLGQCLMGMIFDQTGIMQMEKKPITKRKAISFIISLAGIAVMLLWPVDNAAESFFIYAVMGVLAGMITLFQMAYNSNFAKKKGAFFSARNNVVTGLIGMLLFILITSPKETFEIAKILPSLSFITIIGGGVLGAVVVILSNTVIPKIPGSASSILMSAGTIITSVIYDYINLGVFLPQLLIGSVIMLVGIVLSD